MQFKQKWIGFFMCVAMLLYLQTFLVQPIYANVEDVETDSQNISKTEASDRENGESVGGGGEKVPWWKKLWDDTVEFGEDLLDSAKDQWNEFEKWAGDAWDGAKDWADDAWDGTKDWFSDVGDAIGDWIGDAVDAIGEFFSDAWDWVKENEWFQSLIAGIIAAVAIIGAAILIIGTAPGWLVIGAVALLAIGGSFLYQWIAGDNYNFFGALLSGIVGGLIGYFGMTTGAFAAGWAWLSRTAAPAAWNWIRNTAAPWVVGKGRAVWTWIRGTAVPWVVGKGRAAWTWIRGTAFPWIRGKVVAGWRWFKSLPVWGQIRAGYTNGSFLNVLKIMAQGAGVSGFASMSINIVTQLLGGEAFSFKELFISTGLGALTGGLAAPILMPGLVLSGSLITTLSLASGLENWISGGLTDGEWTSWQNFVSGTLTSFISIGAISKLTGLIPNPFASEIGTKAAEEPVKNWIDELLDWSNSDNKEPIKEPSKPPAVEQPVETPPQQPADAPTTQQPTQQPSDTPSGEQPPSQDETGSTDAATSNSNPNRIHRGINPQPLQ